MPQKTKKIRDFIYLDGDKLYSLYSQVNEGLARQIEQSKFKGEQQTKSQQSAIGEGGSIEARYSDLVHSTESKVLHDYMYAQLEEQIKGSIIEPFGITKENHREKLINTFLVKVKGNAEIADYGRLKHILEKINEIAAGIAYMQEIEALGMKPYELRAALEVSKDQKQKQNLHRYLKEFDNPQEFAKRMGLHQDERQMRYFGFFAELFYLDEIEVIIKSIYDENYSIDFRGILNKDWLRIKPEALRMLYGGLTDFDWTMVAQITFIPNPMQQEQPIFKTNLSADKKPEEGVSQQSVENIEEVLSKSGGEEVTPKPPSMRNALLIMARATRAFESVLMTSTETTEIVVSPLAIYRETEIIV